MPPVAPTGQVKRQHSKLVAIHRAYPKTRWRLFRNPQTAGFAERDRGFLDPLLVMGIAHGAARSRGAMRPVPSENEAA